MANEMVKAPKGPETLVDIRLHPERHPRLCNLPTEQAVEGLKKVYCMAVMYRGQELEAAKADFTARTLLSELLEEETYGLRNVTLEEIRRAVKKAVLTDAEVYGINVASLFRIILAYVKGEGHQADEQAHEIVKRQKRAGNAAADTMLAVYAGQLAAHSKTR